MVWLEAVCNDSSHLLGTYWCSKDKVRGKEALAGTATHSSTTPFTLALSQVWMLTHFTQMILVLRKSIIFIYTVYSYIYSRRVGKHCMLLIWLRYPGTKPWFNQRHKHTSYQIVLKTIRLNKTRMKGTNNKKYYVLCYSLD